MNAIFFKRKLLHLNFLVPHLFRLYKRKIVTSHFVIATPNISPKITDGAYHKKATQSSEWPVSYSSSSLVAQDSLDTKILNDLNPVKDVCRLLMHYLELSSIRSKIVAASARVAVSFGAKRFPLRPLTRFWLRISSTAPFTQCGISSSSAKPVDT